MITIEKRAKASIPPSFRERCVVRCIEHECKSNKKGDKQQIVTQWELIGYFDDQNQLHQELVRGATVYKLAGLRCQAKYFTLTSEAAPFYAEFFEMATGSPLTEIDEDNPDMEYLDNLPMQCIVSGQVDVYRKQLTDEEKKQRKEEGKSEEGDPILDENGKPIEVPKLQLGKFVAKYNGEIDPF